MQTEAKRISKLASGTAVVPGKRLPVTKIKSTDYTSEIIAHKLIQTKINSKNPNPISLIIGHGHTHKTRNYFPLNHLFLDINPVARPDLLGDMRDPNFMKRLGFNTWDSIILTYIPPPHPFHSRNHIIYHNLWKILKPNGKIQSFYLLSMLMKRNLFKSRTDMLEQIQKWARLLNFNASIDKQLVTLTKISNDKPLISSTKISSTKISSPKILSPKISSTNNILPQKFGPKVIRTQLPKSITQAKRELNTWKPLALQVKPYKSPPHNKNTTQISDFNKPTINNIPRILYVRKSI